MFLVRGEQCAYRYDDGCLTLVGPQPVTVTTDGPTTDWIHVEQDVDANLTLQDADIETILSEDGCPAILVARGATLNLTLAGENCALSGWGRAGIELDGGTLVVTEQSSGSLIASSDFGAGIGGGIVGDACYGGTIVINGGHIFALGGKDSSGIGCGANWTGSHDGDEGFSVIVNGGNVFARGTGQGSGIGSVAGRPCGSIVINGGAVRAESEGYAALGKEPCLDVVPPASVEDKSHEHDDSLAWERTHDGLFHATGFNREDNRRVNHACMDVTYELENPGSIAYRWKVIGNDGAGGEIFDRYWFLIGSDGTFRSGTDFLGESDDFTVHLIEGLEAGTYNLTLGVFCFGDDGVVSIDLNPRPIPLMSVGETAGSR